MAKLDFKIGVKIYTKEMEEAISDFRKALDASKKANKELHKALLQLKKAKVEIITEDKPTVK